MRRSTTASPPASRLTAVVIASAIATCVIAAPPAALARTSAVPFTDPNQVGALTLCSQRGRPITSGSLLTVPFVWRAVSSHRAPAGYTRATLVLFQPIQYEAPGDWSGYQLTDDAIFSNPAHPMAQATYADAPLLWPEQSMPPHWDGLYQLRMVFSAPNKVPNVSSYPTAVVKVSGHTWTQVQGGGSSCASGTATSVASLLLPKSETAVPKPAAQVSGSAAGSKQRGGSAPAAAALAVAGTAIAAVFLGGLAGLVIFRRRRRRAGAPEITTIRRRPLT